MQITSSLQNPPYFSAHITGYRISDILDQKEKQEN